VRHAGPIVSWGLHEIDGFAAVGDVRRAQSRRWRDQPEALSLAAGYAQHPLDALGTIGLVAWGEVTKLRQLGSDRP
jgi:hypothetical protein